MATDLTPEKKYMQRCIDLARKGAGYVSPNPMVGCVIVSDGEIIGEGYHQKFGGPHAEPNAIADAESKGHDVKGADLYTNLEPCSHQSKTPPCADHIISKGIGRVFVGMEDPFPQVNGKGIKKLREAGIEVKVGILEPECRELNKFFLKFLLRSRPYVTLKIAQSIDGIIALPNFDSQWITGEESRKYVHQLRSEYDAVLVGRNTALKDNPRLTVRDVEGRNPLRFVLDTAMSLPKKLHLFSDDHKPDTYIFSSKMENDHKYNIVYCKEHDDGLIDLDEALKKMWEKKVQSVLVEGGANVFSQFIERDLFDDIYFFIAPKIIGKGISPFESFTIPSLDNARGIDFDFLKHLGDDILLHYKRK